MAGLNRNRIEEEPKKKRKDKTMNDVNEKQLKVIEEKLRGDATSSNMKLGCDLFSDASPEVQKAVLSRIVLVGDRSVVERLFVLLEHYNECSETEIQSIIQVVKGLLQHTFNISIASEVIATALKRGEKKA
jgi:hypothetical protein